LGGRGDCASGWNGGRRVVVMDNRRGIRGVDDDGAGGGCGEAGGVGRDVVDSVGGDLGRVDNDVARECAVEEVFQAEVEVGKWRGDCGAEVLVGRADLDVGGVFAVDGDDRRSG